MRQSVTQNFIALMAGLTVGTIAHSPIVAGLATLLFATFLANLD